MVVKGVVKKGSMERQQKETGEGSLHAKVYLQHQTQANLHNQDVG